MGNIVRDDSHNPADSRPTPGSRFILESPSPLSNPVPARTGAVAASVLLEASPDAVVVVDSSGRMVLVNCQTEKMFGKGRLVMLGQEVCALFHENHRAILAQQLRLDSLCRDITSALELVGLREDGREFLAEIRLGAVVGGDHYQVMLTVREKRAMLGAQILEQLHAGWQQQRTTESVRHHLETQIFEGALALLLETSPDSIYFKDRQSRFIRMSRSQANRFGLGDPTAAIGKTDFDFFDEAHALSAYADEQQIMATGIAVVNKEERLRGTSGKSWWVLSTKLPLRDATGRVIGTMGISRDITRLKRVQQHLEAQCALAHTLVKTATLAEAAPSILRILAETGDWDLAVLWRHDASERVLRCVDLWHDPVLEVKPFENLTLQSTLTSGQDCAGKAWTAGKFFWEEYTEPATPRARAAVEVGLRRAGAFPMLRGTDVLGVVELFSREALALTEDLPGMFESIGNQLGQYLQQKELEEQILQARKMEAIGTLAGGVAHDFNNLLTVINGYSEVLRGFMAPHEPAWEMINEVLRAGQRAAELTRQLLAFGRKQMLQPVRLNLNQLVRQMVPALKRVLGEQVELVLKLEPDLWPVFADPAKFNQALLNLASNAYDAMPAGGCLVVETNNLPNTDGPRAQVALKITDSGVGMEANVRSRLFEPFFTTKEVGRGTGLGLASVYGIVQQSHGQIEVESEVGRGTTFTILLPRVE